MTTFRGKRVNRGKGYIPPTHMKDGSLKYPDGPAKLEPTDYTEMPPPKPLPPKKKEEE